MSQSRIEKKETNTKKKKKTIDTMKATNCEISPRIMVCLIHFGIPFGLPIILSSFNVINAHIGQIFNFLTIR